MINPEKNQELKARAAELRAKAEALAAEAREIEAERLQNLESGFQHLSANRGPGPMRPVQSGRKKYDPWEARGEKPIERAKILHGAVFVPNKPKGE